MAATANSAVPPHVKVSGSRLRSANHNISISCPAAKSFLSINCCSSEGLRDHQDFSFQASSISSRNFSDGRNGVSGSYLGASVQKRSLVGQTFCSAGVCTFGEHALGSPSHAATERVGVLLLNLGGPETLQDVQPFLFNLFADPDIIRLPRPFRFLQRPLAQLISVLRAPKSKEGYAAIGGGSPLRKITDEQAHALKMALEEKEMPVNVYVGMRYWHPFTEEAVHQIKKDSITRLVVLPLYPQFSISTSGSSIRLLQSIFR
nr:TPA_asm: hypothetical protein HUJ06_002702 [Nelumbo nucifera]